MKTYSLPKRTVSLWRLRIAALFLFLLLIVFFLPLPRTAALIITALLSVLFAAAAFWYLPRFIKSCRITVVNDSIIIKRGIIVENTHILPFSRLIHTQSVQTPLSRMFSLTMIFFKATRFNLIVPELTDADAKELMTEISAEGVYE